MIGDMSLFTHRDQVIGPKNLNCSLTQFVPFVDTFFLDFAFILIVFSLYLHISLPPYFAHPSITEVSMYTPRRRGFTLIELLVVIAVIAILIALLVPAVQKVRAAAARTQCENNLKNIGLGIHNYYGVRKYFPSAFTSPPAGWNASTNGLQGYEGAWAWSATILPFVDQGSIYDALKVETKTFGISGAGSYPTLVDVANVPLGQKVIPVYKCPGDRGPELDDQRGNFAISNYRATCGPNPTLIGTFTPDQDWGGVMYQDSKTKFEQITDGSSNTLIIGECMYDYDATSGTGRKAAIWAGMRGTGPVNGACCSVFISDVMWWMDPSTATINGPASQAFSSQHGGGAYFLFADGTVRFARQEVDPNIMIWLSGRADGKVYDISAIAN
jgi:prepilin-type N-terminal cleavage/methylation domain-containing protein/prepilin-type processing-associated H-X9-DG protein